MVTIALVGSWRAGGSRIRVWHSIIDAYSVLTVRFSLDVYIGCV